MPKTDDTTVIAGRCVSRQVCGYCGSYRDVVPFARTPETWHDGAQCVEMPEPIR